jgi:hypothetical protein
MSSPAHKASRPKRPRPGAARHARARTRPLFIQSTLALTAVVASVTLLTSPFAAPTRAQWSKQAAATSAVDTEWWVAPSAPNLVTWNVEQNSTVFATSVLADSPACPAGAQWWRAQDQGDGGVLSGWSTWVSAGAASTTGVRSTTVTGATIGKVNFESKCIDSHGLESVTVPYAITGLKRTGVNSPRGNSDSITALGGGNLRLQGWTFDPDLPGGSIPVHIYYDGVGGRNIGFATGWRPDVAAAFAGVGNYHGYDVTLSFPVGVHRISIYAINVSGGDNILLWDANVTVT